MSEERVLEANESVLSAFQMDSLTFDLPISDLAFDDKSNLWLAGKNHLWKWDDSTARLQRIQLTTPTPDVPGKPATSDHLQSLGTDGASLFVGSTNALYQVRWSPFSVHRYSLNGQAPGRSIGFTGSGDRYFWIHDSGVYLIDRYGKTLLKQSSTPQAQFVAYDEVSNQTWSIESRRLKLTDSSVHVAEKPFRGLATWQGGVVAYTSEAILFFAVDGEIMKNIPVTQGRRLIKADFREKLHGYLFGDGILEIYSLDSRARSTYRLPTDTLRSLQTIRVSEDRAALLVNGMPRLYALPKAISSERAP